MKTSLGNPPAALVEPHLTFVAALLRDNRLVRVVSQKVSAFTKVALTIAWYDQVRRDWSPCYGYDVNTLAVLTHYLRYNLAKLFL